jgi:hypothetical protein
MYHIISQKMRQLARLLLTARGVNTGVEHLGDLIDPSKFDLVRQAVQTVGGLSKVERVRQTVPVLEVGSFN